MYLYVRESPTGNIVCSFNINRREAAKKIASYMKKNCTRNGTQKDFCFKMPRANTMYY